MTHSQFSLSSYYYFMLCIEYAEINYTYGYIFCHLIVLIAFN